MDKQDVFYLIWQYFGVLLVSVWFYTSFSSASLLDDYNLTMQDKESVCSSLNMSFMECFVLWDSVDSFEVCNYTGLINESEINTTCSIQNLSCEFDSQLELIDEYLERGFEPVFLKGEVTNWKVKPTVSSDFINKSVCETEKEQSYNNGKASCEVVSKSVFSGEPSSFPWIYVIIGVVVLFVFWKFDLLGKFLKKEDYSRVSYNPSNSSTPLSIESGYSHQTKPEVGSSGPHFNAMDEKQGSFIRDKTDDTNFYGGFK